jgi:adenylate cyclase
VAEDAGLIAAGDTSGRVDLAVVFVDLSQFTSLTVAMGDDVAADLLDRFSELVRREVLMVGGRVVKQIGDEFMLVFADARSAVHAALAVRTAAAREPAFLATRIGIHAGTVICREGDYVGGTVNLAARITSQAAAHQVLVSEAVRGRVGDLDARFEPIGARDLKGFDSAVVLYEVEPQDASEATAVDPVCGMVLRHAGAAARLRMSNVELVFSSGATSLARRPRRVRRRPVRPKRECADGSLHHRSGRSSCYEVS